MHFSVSAIAKTHLIHDHVTALIKHQVRLFNAVVNASRRPHDNMDASANVLRLLLNRLTPDDGARLDDPLPRQQLLQFHVNL